MRGKSKKKKKCENVGHRSIEVAAACMSDF